MANDHNPAQPFFLHCGTTGTEAFQIQLQRTVQQLSDKLAQYLKPAPNTNAAELEPLVAQQATFTAAGRDFEALLEQTLTLLVEQSVRVHHPHCAAHLHCPPLIPALAAEVVLTTLNQSMDSWDQAPAATHMEQQLSDWLCQQFGYQTDGDVIPDGSFTSGGTQSNLMGLLLARDSVMNKDSAQSLTAQKQASVQQQGLPADFSRYKVLCSETAHFSIAKSCALLGLGRDAVLPIATDLQGRLCARALTEQLQQMETFGEKPLAIVATAGTTDLGAIDPMPQMAALAREYNCWFHVDAAYGGALILSNEHRQRLAGIELADSITVDFHKMFFQPVSCSALLVKDASTLAPLCFHADYLSREDDDELNLVDKSMSTTRRFDAFKLWLSLQHLGLDVFGGLIDHLMQLSQDAAQLIEQIPELQLLAQPSISTLLFRLRPESWQSDAFHQRLRRQLLQSGQAVIAETRIDNTLYLKLTLLNPCTTAEDIQKLLNLIVQNAQQISPR